MADAEQQGLAQAAQTTGNEKMSVYTVQRAILIDDNEEDGFTEADTEATDLWQDVGTVEVPIRSHRKSAVVAALEKFAIPEDSHPSFFRAIEQEIAEPIPVTVEQPPAPPARLKVGR